MKKLILGLFFIFSGFVSFTQDSLQGIYLSVTDFKRQKISYAPVKGMKYKMQLHETFYKPTIKITIGDSIYFLKKDSVFGYRDKSNCVYRFYQKHVYKVLNRDEIILLYSRSTLGGYKNLETIVTYYFSSNSKILPLTKQNLKNEFPNYPAFIEMLDMYFGSDADLMQYDSFYKLYKLNRVFQFSIQLILKSN